MIRAKILADSVSPDGIRLTTVEYTAHRYILAEINTHRVFSRNARSSRAVPTKTLIEEVRTNMARPITLAKNKPGMQAGEALSDSEMALAYGIWEQAGLAAATYAESMMLVAPAHKQWVNRILEPYIWVHGVISSTEWGNWETLRIDPDAQPEIHALALAVQEAQRASTPRLLEPGAWHLPYITDEDWDRVDDWLYGNGGRGPAEVDGVVDAIRRVSAARCARVSYTPFDGNPDYAKELERAAGLIHKRHWSPFEHQATPDINHGSEDVPIWADWRQHRNYLGWRQHRAVVGG